MMARMIDIGDKKETLRIASAMGSVTMQEATRRAIEEKHIDKGDVLAVAQMAAVMAAKATPAIVPLCHPIALASVNVQCDFTPSHALRVTVTAKSFGRTGVEMEALTAVMAACLTIYDMCKSIDRRMVIGEVKLLTKEGGRSGEWRRDD